MRKSHQILLKNSLYVSLAVTLSLGCVASSDADDDTTDNTTTTVVTTAPSTTATTTTTTSTTTSTTISSVSDVLTQNALALAVPVDLGVSLLPQDATSTSLALNDADGEEKSLEKKSIKDKADDAKQILSGEVDSCLPPVFKQSRAERLQVSCYEFDQDMVYGGRLEENDDTSRFNGTLDGTDGDGEACMVSFARSKVSNVINFVDESLGMVQAMVCQAKKNDSTVDVPAVDETLDLKAALTGAMGEKAQRITSATMKRLADVDGRAVFSSKVVMDDANGSTRTMQLVHSPDASSTNSTYNGTLYVTMVGDFGGDRQGNAANKSRVLSITYAKVLDDAGIARLKYELRTARIADELVANAINDAGVLDLNVGTDFTSGNDFGKTQRVDGSGYFQQANDALDAVTFIAFDINPEDSTGTISYWQNPGGKYTEPTRGMNFSLADDNGVIKGCASSGAASTSFNDATALNQENAGVSIRRALKEGLSLAAKGYWHPQLHAGNGTTTSAGGDSDDDGTFHTKTNTDHNGNSSTLKWYKVKSSDEALALRFFEQTSGTITTRQCFKKDETTGKYVIDSEVIADEAGYELVASDGDSTNKIVPPPTLTDVRPLEADVKED